ncbi:hypothetical protein BCR34DRAFT_604885 [Clohesyomyces aquaticus]|uniref:Uncharacterized protein n=1 Tax=Clohesyomyces aquaticus TaxID=1231657 RepID=A0A1Y1Z243_9PLEO|nr:hypothetical protein BCR34DRAFT_604885 [Clohesyomyces aquaticus]
MPLITGKATASSLADGSSGLALVTRSASQNVENYDNSNYLVPSSQHQQPAYWQGEVIVNNWNNSDPTNFQDHEAQIASTDLKNYGNLNALVASPQHQQPPVWPGTVIVKTEKFEYHNHHHQPENTQSYKAQITQQQSQLQETKTAYEKTVEEREALQASLGTFQSEATKYRTDHSTEVERHNATKKKSERYQSQLQVETTAHEQTLKEKESLNALVAEKDGKIQGLEWEKWQLQNDKTSLEQQLEALQITPRGSEQAGLAEQWRQWGLRRESELQAEISELKSTRQASWDRVSALQTENQELKSTLQTSRATISTRDMEIKELKRDKIGDAQTKIAGFRDQHNQCETKQQNFGAKNKGIASDFERRRSEFQASRSQLEVLQTRISRLDPRNGVQYWDRGLRDEQRELKSKGRELAHSIQNILSIINGHSAALKAHYETTQEDLAKDLSAFGTAISNAERKAAETVALHNQMKTALSDLDTQILSIQGGVPERYAEELRWLNNLSATASDRTRARETQRNIESLDRKRRKLEKEL